ncbi:MAG: DNA sulfur modification protein DndD [Kastovskya adunca ATA6-11-RM4]|nr:DNA sulfur modification protein DndD [Kastovskya adunca ATA6-11-RM4]
MIFLELVLQNFGPYQGRQVINLSPEENGSLRPIILLGGMNGGGKTTLMDAIRLAFYGPRAQCSTRGNLSYSDFLAQCVNSYAKPTEETAVELAFEHVLNNVQVVCRIKRTWTKNPQNGKDHLEVSIDTWLDDALTKTWEERIEDVLPLGISNLFLFDGEQVKELAELDAPPASVVDAIQSLLGLELAQRLSTDLEIIVNRKRKLLASKSELATIEAIEAKLQEHKDKKKAANKELASRQVDLKTAQDNLQKTLDKYTSEGGKIAAESSQLEQTRQALAEEGEANRDRLRGLAADVLPLVLIQPLLTEAQTQGEKELKRQQAEMARDVLKARDGRLIDYITELSLKPAQIDKIKSFLAIENRQLEKEIASTEESWLGADTETLHQLASLLGSQLLNQIKVTTEQLDKLKNIEEETASTEKQLLTAASPEAFELLKVALSKAQTELAQAQAAYEAIRRHCEDLDNAIAKIKKELEQYGKQTIDRKSDEHIINRAASVQDTLKLFRERLTLHKLNKLELEVTECFRFLLHKSDLVHRVAIDSQTYSLSLYNLQSAPVPKHRLSAGEKQLLAIAFLWGLARISGRKLPVAIDTPLGRLDSSHRQNLVERYFPDASHQVILLSTDTEIGALEVEQLRESKAIAREYLLKYDPSKRQTVVEQGYFW